MYPSGSGLLYGVYRARETTHTDSARTTSIRGKRSWSQQSAQSPRFRQSLWYYLGAYILNRGWCCGPVEDGNSTAAPAQSPVKATSGKAGLSMQKARVHHNFYSNLTRANVRTAAMQTQTGEQTTHRASPLCRSCRFGSFIEFLMVGSGFRTGACHVSGFHYR